MELNSRLPSIDEAIKQMGEPDSLNGSKKWRAEDQVALYELRLKGYSVNQIAQAFGVSYYVVTSNLSMVKRAVKIVNALKVRGLLTE